MAQWWFAYEGKTFGPVSDIEIEELIQRRAVAGDTPVWCDGMSGWLPLATIGRFDAFFVRPPPLSPPPSSKQGKEQQSMLLTPRSLGVEAERNSVKVSVGVAWRRLVARYLDLLIALLVIVAIQIGLVFVSPPFQLWVQKPETTWVLMVFGLIAIPFVQSCFEALFGNSPAKTFLGLWVRDHSDNELSFRGFLARNYKATFYGLGCYLPLVSLITMGHQYRKLRHEGATGYDAGKYVVHARNVSWIRMGLAVPVTICALVALRLVDQHEAIRDSEYRTGQEWINPVTQSRVAIPSGWRVSSQNNSDGQRIDIFTRPEEELMIIFAMEKVNSSFGLGEYAQAFARSVGSSMNLLPSRAEQIGLQDAVVYTGGITSDATQRVTVTLVKFGNEVWRTVGVRQRGANPETVSYLNLRRDLLYSASTR